MAPIVNDPPDPNDPSSDANGSDDLHDDDDQDDDLFDDSDLDDDDDDDDDEDFFSNVDDDDDDDAVTPLAIAWPPERHESPVYRVVPEAVSIEKVIAGDDHKLRVTLRVESTHEGSLAIKELVAVLHDASGAPIGSEDTFLDRHVAGSAELQGTFDFGPHAFDLAASVTFRFQYEYKFKKLTVAKVRFSPAFRKTEEAYREMVPFDGKLDAAFPLATPRVSVTAGRSWCPVLDIVLEAAPASSARRLAVDVKCTVVDENGKRMAKDEVYFNLEYGRVVRRFRFDADDVAVDRIRGAVITSKGELEGSAELGPFALG